MAAKILIASVLVFFICQMVINIVVGEVPTASPTDNDSKAVGDAIEGFKKGVEDLLKQVQENPLFKNISSVAQQLGEALESQSKQLVDNIKSSTPKK